MFERYVSIDWSGADIEDRRVDIRVVEASEDQQGHVVDPPAVRAPIKSWSRAEAVEYLANVLRPGGPPTLVALDFGFGLPWGSDHAIFQCRGWRAMLELLAQLYRRHGTARATAQEINADLRFNGHGPYRFDEKRTDGRFYIDHGVAYYRLTEAPVPQAISQWYVGSGGQVGFSTITGLATLARLLNRRDDGMLSFTVWPHETLEPTGDGHLIVESYPATCPEPENYGPCDRHDKHQRDAWRVLDWMQRAGRTETLDDLFLIPSIRFGRIEGVSFVEQVQFEGWIIGVR